MRSFPAHSPNMAIEVTVRVEGGVQQEVETRPVCAQCRQTLEIWEDGPKKPHVLTCPKHGRIATFSSEAAYHQAVKVITNRVLEAKGHELISDGASCTPVPLNPEIDPKKTN